MKIFIFITKEFFPCINKNFIYDNISMKNKI